MNAEFYFKDDRKVYSHMSVTSKHLTTYYKGEKVKYHSIHIGRGYIWIEYKRANGGKGFIPIGLAPDISLTIK